MQIRAKTLLLLDEMVASLTNKKQCRKATGLDFDKLDSEDMISLEDDLNPYLNKLEELVTPFGVRVAGRKVWQKLSGFSNPKKVKAVKKYHPTFKDGINNIIKAMFTVSKKDYDEHGEVRKISSRDIGFTKVFFEDKSFIVQTTHPLNDFYLMGIFESFISFYGNWAKKSVRRKNKKTDEYSELYFEW